MPRQRHTHVTRVAAGPHVPHLAIHPLASLVRLLAQEEEIKKRVNSGEIQRLLPTYWQVWKRSRIFCMEPDASFFEDGLCKQMEAVALQYIGDRSVCRCDPLSNEDSVLTRAGEQAVDQATFAAAQLDQHCQWIWREEVSPRCGCLMTPAWCRCSST